MTDAAARDAGKVQSSSNDKAIHKSENTDSGQVYIPKQEGTFFTARYPVIVDIQSLSKDSILCIT